MTKLSGTLSTSTPTIRHDRITEYNNFSPATFHVSRLSPQSPTALQYKESSNLETPARSHVIFFHVDSDAWDLDLRASGDDCYGSTR
jgi:hypothetical protein